MTPSEPSTPFLLCIGNDGYSVTLEVRMVYQSLPDPAAASRGFVRVIDESGEDDLFPAEVFVPVELPEKASRVFAGADA